MPSADITYRVRFSSSEDGTQTATLHRVEGAEAAGMVRVAKSSSKQHPCSTGQSARVTEAGGYSLFVGWRSDRFSSTHGGR